MAWSESRIFRNMITDVLTTAAQAPDLDADAFAAALFNDSITPDRDVAAALARYGAASGAWATAGEVSSSGQWDVGGKALVTPTLSQIAGGINMFDAADTASGSAATLANVFGALVYDTTKSNKPGLSYNYLGGAQSVSNGTFTVVWAANGIWRLTV